MGLFRKVIKWILFVFSAVMLAYFTAVIADFPMWVGIVLFIVYLGIIIATTHYIRKKIYQKRAGFIESVSAMKSLQTDLYTTYLQT